MAMVAGKMKFDAIEFLVQRKRVTFPNGEA